MKKTQNSKIKTCIHEALKEEYPDISIDELFDILIENGYTENFTSLIMENLQGLRLLFKYLKEHKLDLKNLEIIEARHKYKLGLKIETDSIDKILIDLSYIRYEDGYFFLSETYSYSKDMYNYDKNITPYIKPQKANPLVKD